MPRVDWCIVENPSYGGRAPRPLEVACHDRSPLLTIRCGCGDDLHVHETQIAPLPAGAVVGARCPGCRGVLAIPSSALRAAFADMRAAGWYE